MKKRLLSVNDMPIDRMAMLKRVEFSFLTIGKGIMVFDRHKSYSSRTLEQNARKFAEGDNSAVPLVLYTWHPSQKTEVFDLVGRKSNPGVLSKTMSREAMRERMASETHRLKKDTHRERVEFDDGSVWMYDPRFEHWAIWRGPTRASNPSRRSIHTAKWDRCVKDVSARGGAKSAAAVCTATIGYRGSVKKGHRRRNPSILKKKMSESEMATHIRETHPLAAKISKDQKSLILDDGSKWVWDSRFEHWAMVFPPRSQNPLPSVRKVYYIICAHKGAENYYLARSGKLTRSQAGAQRFPTAQAAIDKAKAHLRAYAASRKYRFDLKLAY